jgi:hypothetical protein
MTPRPPPVLGRERELEVLERFSQALMRGTSGALVIHGEAGIGKTTLIERFLANQTSCQITAISGVESEMELAWAGLHQLCAPMLRYLPRIPAPQSAAIQSAFGIAAAASPDHFFCGLAVLSLLTEAAEETPLICVIDDAYALDQASLKTLAFVSRRLQSESVGLIFATREIPSDLAGLTELHIKGLDRLDPHDAGALLDSSAHARLDPAIRERVIAENGHLLQLAGVYDIPSLEPASGGIEESFLKTVQVLDAPAQSLLLLAAADSTGDPMLLRRSVIASNLEMPDLNDATLRRLISLTPSVRFRHPLVRSAIYTAANDADRRAAHRALAEACKSPADQDRHAWHLARSLENPDEEVAAELERVATGATPSETGQEASDSRKTSESRMGRVASSRKVVCCTGLRTPGRLSSTRDSDCCVAWSAANALPDTRMIRRPVRSCASFRSPRPFR